MYSSVTRQLELVQYLLLSEGQPSSLSLGLLGIVIIFLLLLSSMMKLARFFPQMSL